MIPVCLKRAILTICLPGLWTDQRRGLSVYSRWLCCWLLCAWQVQAQDMDIKFDKISVREGLSQHTIHCILQDSQGFVWIGTQDGLNRYDGYSFTIYNYQPNFSYSISNNFINDLHEDHEGNIWVGTRNGLNRFDRNTGNFHRVGVAPNKLPGEAVNDIAEDEHGVMWVATSGGLARYNPSDSTFEHFFYGGLRQPKEDPENHFRRLLIDDKRHRLWAGTRKGLLLLDRKTGEFAQYQPKNLPRESQSVVNALLLDQEGTLWVAIANLGLFTFDENTAELVHQPMPFGIALEDQTVNALFQDHKLNTWIATFGSGAYMVSKSGEIAHFVNNPADEYSLSQNTATSFYEDRTKVLWIGTGKGLCKFDNNVRLFSNLKHVPGNANSLSTNFITSVYEDSKGNIWVGSYGKGMDRIDARHQRFGNYKPPGTPPSLVVWSIAETANGHMLTGTSSGLWKLNPTTGQFDQIRLKTIPYDEIAISSIQRDPIKGGFWIGTYGYGLLYMDEKGQETRYSTDDANAQSISHDRVRCLHLTHDGHLWIGTEGGGINHFNRNTNTFTVYRNIPGRTETLSNDYVISITEDHRGYLWLGTEGGGVFRFSPKTQEFINFTTQHGLPNNVVYGVLEDRQYRLWMSTNRGITCFDPEDKTFKNYDVTDGLQGNEFNRLAFCQGKTGVFYFGGMEGLTFFRPQQITHNPYIPNVVLTELLIFNKKVPVQPHNPDAILRKIVSQTAEIRLDYANYLITFEFAALHYANPKKNRYYYKMENFDEQWIDAGHNRSATYTNLPPGEYIFRVKGSNHHGVWNEQGASIRVVIVPPFWQTRSFLWLSGVTLALTVILLFRQRLIRLQQSKRQLEEMVRQRTGEIERQAEEISVQNASLALQKEEIELRNANLLQLNEEKNHLISILSHDLRSPVNQMLGMLGIIRMTHAEDEELQDLVARIEKSGRNQLEMISKILDVEAIESRSLNMKSEKINATELVRQLVIQYADAAKQKDISLHLALRETPQFVKADRNYTGQVYENLLSNAIKFSPIGKSIYITLEDQMGMVRFGVKDEGPGIKPEDMKRMFGKFQKLSATPTGGEKSTGIGLSIVKKYTEAMGGKVWCESEYGHGATFYAAFSVWKEQT